jgi:5'-deoxynucleotidase YfbR-like HD superfamily hydrolase
MPTATYTTRDETLFKTDENLDDQEVDQAAETCMQLGYMAMRFARIERVPRYDQFSRENDAEHSFMLSLVATEIAQQYFPYLNAGLVSQFGTVHDLIELETGDVATFTLDQGQLHKKEAAEHSVIEKLLASLPEHTASLLRRYELQIEPEARLVRLIDKILPVIVDILGPGKKVMAEDYGITTVEQLDNNEDQLNQRLRDRFPDRSLEFLHLVRDELAHRFSADFAFETAA